MVNNGKRYDRRYENKTKARKRRVHSFKSGTRPGDLRQGATD